jgi:hypothetical protein
MDTPTKFEDMSLEEIVSTAEWYKKQLLNKRKQIDNTLNELNQLLPIKEWLESDELHNLGIDTIQNTKERLIYVLKGKKHKDRLDN